MRIENYKPADLPRLTFINDACFQGLERPPHEEFKQILSISEVWVAKTDATTAFVDDFVIGHIVVQRTFGAYLWQVAVDPNYQNRGVAGYLMSHAEQFCKSKGDAVVRLHCKNDNPSQKLYFDRGYRVYDVSYGYYGDGTIALLMKKELN